MSYWESFWIGLLGLAAFLGAVFTLFAVVLWADRKYKHGLDIACTIIIVIALLLVIFVGAPAFVARNFGE